jgi:threonine/homoserine/homoserine lactone efflux protein
LTADRYLSFIGVAVVLALIPGPDTMVSLRFALRGRRLGWWTAAGSSVSMLLWAGLAGAGVAAVLRTSRPAFTALAVMGGLYLVYLGIRAAMSAPSTGPKGANGQTLVTARHGMGAWSAFLAGALTDLTNPKTGLFFLALFPQFIPVRASTVYVVTVLGVPYAAIVFIELVGVVIVADAANRWLARPRVSRGLNLITAGVMVVIGLATVSETLLDIAAGSAVAAAYPVVRVVW